MFPDLSKIKMGGIKYKKSTIKNQSFIQKKNHQMGPQICKIKNQNVEKMVGLSKPVNRGYQI
jgi:hypothetical protein